LENLRLELLKETPKYFDQKVQHKLNHKH